MSPVERKLDNRRKQGEMLQDFFSRCLKQALWDEKNSEFLSYVSFSAAHLGSADRKELRNVVSTSAGFMLVASEPILTSKGQGPVHY